jgi:tetratricopeptide (TPR) repeat protein
MIRKMSLSWPFGVLVVICALLLMLMSIQLKGSEDSKEAVVVEELKSFKTYPFSDPDPIPNIGYIYPYFKFSGYSHVGKPRDWKMVRLENPFIRVWVCPEIGGKVWGALEKTSNKEFIYYNNVVKFRNIAMRGPWTSGGIEFNFGVIGHTPTTATSVDYILKKNSDGSVSCVVGALDLPSRTWWRVDIRLPEDKAFFETNAFWYNPSALNHSLYHWMNASADSGEDLKLYYPGNRYIDHGGKAFSWPKDNQGRDISVYRNNSFGPNKSYHVIGNYTEFFGGYWQSSGFGFGNWSLYNDKPGKKAWIWALSRQGEIWRDLLTDKENKQYIEMQSGLLLNQAGRNSSETPFKHAFFPPYSSYRWKECWFPVKGIGGMRDANQWGILNVIRENEEGKNTLRIGICALQNLDQKIVVMAGNKKVYEKSLKLSPMQVFQDSLDLLPEMPEIKDFQVVVGNHLLEHSSAQEEESLLSRPIKMPEDFNCNSAEGLFIAGKELAKQRQFGEALLKLKDCLRKEPCHTSALTLMAELYFRRAEYDKALGFARKVLSVDAYDEGGNFIYGATNKALGKFADAKDGFAWAARSMKFRSAAYTELSKIFLLELKLEKAKMYAMRSLDYNRFNMEGYKQLAIINRLLGKKDRAYAWVKKMLDFDPLSHFARFERFLLDPIKEKQEDFTSMIRNELPHESFLELGIGYYNLGLSQEAIRVLELSPPHPMVHWWLAFLYKDSKVDKKEREKRCQANFKKALKAPADLVFPFRTESIPVLKWANHMAPKTPNAWKLKYFLSLILWNKGRLTEALELMESCCFNKCSNKKPCVPFGPFYIARANLRKSVNPGDPEKILKDLKNATHKKQGDWRAWDSIYKFYINRLQYKNALKVAKRIYKKHPENYQLAMNYARALLFNRQYKDCLLILIGTQVLPYEGAWEGRDIFRQVNLLLAVDYLKKRNIGKALMHIKKAREWPENLGVGRPYDVDERLENYLQGLCLQNSGDSKKAKETFAKIADYTEIHRSKWGSLHFIGALAMKSLGRNKEANKLLLDWKSSVLTDEDDMVYAWALAKFKGNDFKAAEILKHKKSDSESTPWNPAHQDRDFGILIKVIDSLSIGN